MLRFPYVMREPNARGCLVNNLYDLRIFESYLSHREFSIA